MITINHKSIQIPVIASAKGWLAVDKPAGLTVHNDPGQDLCTIARDYITKKPQLFKHIEMDPEFGIHPVHRLDRETSGVLLLAADRETFRCFARQFESRQVRKRYVAVLHGRLESPDGKWGVWRRPLAKEAGGRKNPAGSGQKQPCETRYRIMGHSDHYTMAEVDIATGRKHQIRRHAKLAGHPVAGDSRYGSDRAVRFLKENCGFDRLGLHARSLTVTLPNPQGTQQIETAEIPDQMRELIHNDIPTGRKESNIF
jgi:RluA family pseudouridine synthase